MAININAPKNVFLMPFFALVVVLIPFALLFSLVRLPFAQRRIEKLPDILRNDWIPRRKYIYIGLTAGFPLSDYVRKNVIRTYGENIIWDEWDGKEWSESEPDTSRRITTFWQDIGGDFDGNPMIIIATYGQDDLDPSSVKNFHQFWLEDDSFVYYGGEKITETEAETKVNEIILGALDLWLKNGGQ